MELSMLTRPLSNKAGRRVGRGGKRGKTSGRGGKGQTARAGNKRRPEWRDIIKKFPKRRGHGVNRAKTVRNQTPAAPVTLEVVEKNFNAGDTVTIAALIQKGIVRRISGKVPPIKVLNRGTLTKKVAFQKGIGASKEAASAIKAAGGTIE